MTIRRLDVFFRTQITLDTPSTFNSITNLAFAPLQQVVGQKQYQSLKGKVSAVPLTIAPPPFYASLMKVIILFAFFLALVLTPIGIATRNLSFRSPQIDRAYSHAFLLQLSPFDRTSKLMESSFAFMRKMNETERTELLNDLPDDLALSFLSLPIHREFTNAILSQLSPSKQIALLKKLPAAAQGSFLSLDANAEFSKKYVQEITEAEYNPLMPHLSENLIEFYQAQKAENTKKKSLDDSLSKAIVSLADLRAKLIANGAQDPWVDQFRSNPLYPFPFYLAQQLETNPKIVARADKILWERFQSLKQSCLNFLNPDCDEMLLQSIRAQANATRPALFKFNVGFFNALKTKLESNMETAEIRKWLDDQKRTPNYSYPFYTQPSVLELMGQTAAAEKLKPFSKILSICEALLKERKLESYTTEEPPENHATVNALMVAMAQLKNIASLQNLIKMQSA